MDKSKDTVDAETLRTWLENNDPVFVLDVRPSSQREEWQIPGSHFLPLNQLRLHSLKLFQGILSLCFLIIGFLLLGLQ